MKRTVLGALVGAVVYFAWGFVSWMVLPWHATTVKALPNETFVMDTLKTVLKEPGFYAFPHDMHNPSASQPDGKLAWEERTRSGPLGAIAISPTGREPMGKGVLFQQFLSGVGVAALLLVVLFAARKSWVSVGCRALLGGIIGLGAGLAAHVQHRVWFSFPWDYTIVNILDLVVGFALASAAMATFVPED